MLRISKSQMSVLTSNRVAKFKETMAAHLGELAPDHVAAMGPENMVDFLNQAIKRARRYDIYQQETTRLWLELSMLWGIGFASDPTYEFAHAIAASQMPELPRMRRMHAASIDYTNRTCGADGQHFRAALERLQFAQTPDVGAQLDNKGIGRFLAHLWPERAETIGPTSLEELAEQTGIAALEFGSPANNERILFAALGLILGSSFASDPQYRWLLRTPAEDDAPHARFDAINSRSRAYLRTVLRDA